MARRRSAAAVMACREGGCQCLRGAFLSQAQPAGGLQQ